MQARIPLMELKNGLPQKLSLVIFSPKFYLTKIRIKANISVNP